MTVPVIQVWDLKDCPRCGEDHPALEYTAFDGKAFERVDDGTKWQWWYATCPTTSDGILRRQELE